MNKLLPLAIAALFVSLPVPANVNWRDFYQIENIEIPKEIDPQIGGLTVLKDGRVAAAFHRGQVAIYSPKMNTWQTFAEGLHEPLGDLEEASGALVVMQMPELTRLIDENGDGKADYYQALSTDFGMSGNYHEFAFGPAVDSKGNYYISLNVASNYAGIFKHIRGEFNPIGLSREAMTHWQNDDWKNETRHLAGRMFSKVPYRGWVLQVTPTGDTIPYALGFRSPNGLWVDENDKLWVTDNQGDWLGTSPLYQVEKGKFYGHPASLIWQNGWTQDPVKMSPEALAELKSPPAALFPQSELANSPTQPLSTIDPKLFGLPKGELLVGDMNQVRLIRFLPDQVNGFTQGALIPFLEDEKLGIGNNRLAFDKTGNLWVGKTHLGWAGDEGIRKISWRGKPLFIVEQAKLTPQGFELSFNHPLNKSSFEQALKVVSHTYHYHAEYGSEKVNETVEPVDGLTFSDSNKTVKFSLAQLKKSHLYTIHLSGVVNSNSLPLMGDIVRYNVVEKLNASH